MLLSIAYYMLMSLKTHLCNFLKDKQIQRFSFYEVGLFECEVGLFEYSELC